MPIRATKRGEQRTTVDRDCDVLICGASFAGLCVARELEGSGARTLIVDRYEIGERQTSACAAPTEWLEQLGVAESILQTFREIKIHTRLRDFSLSLPYTFSTFDYRELCRLLLAQAPSAEFETAKVEGITRSPGGAHTVLTDRGPLRAPLVVDALGWRRVLDPSSAIQPPQARLSRGLEVHPPATGEELEIWIDPRYVRAGYAWSFPARDEVRVGVGSFEPRDHVKEPTVRLAADLGVEALGYQGNWIPHKLRPATAAGVFFVGDSAGHCLPLTAEGIRTAFYFGLALGRELRLVVEGNITREQALQRYADFSERHAWHFRWLLRLQHLVGRITGLPLATTLLEGLEHQRVLDWAFRRYLALAPPDFARRPQVIEGQVPGGSGHASSLLTEPRPGAALPR